MLGGYIISENISISIVISSILYWIATYIAIELNYIPPIAIYCYSINIVISIYWIAIRIYIYCYIQTGHSWFFFPWCPGVDWCPGPGPWEAPGPAAWLGGRSPWEEMGKDGKTWGRTVWNMFFFDIFGKNSWRLREMYGRNFWLFMLSIHCCFLVKLHIERLWFPWSFVHQKIHCGYHFSLTNWNMSDIEHWKNIEHVETHGCHGYVPVDHGHLKQWRFQKGPHFTAEQFPRLQRARGPDPGGGWSGSVEKTEEPWQTLAHCVYKKVYSHRQNYGKKNVSIYRRRLSMIEKLRTFFFPIIIVSIIIFFSIILSVTVCPSIRNLNAF